MTQGYRYLLATLFAIALVGCARNGEEVQLQEGPIDPNTNQSQLKRSRLVTVRNSRGIESTVDLDKLRANAANANMRESDAADSDYVDNLIATSQATRETGRGAHNNNYSLYFGYIYYPNYYNGNNNNNNYNYCGWFYGSYGQNWNSNCGYNYYYPNYGYNYSNTNGSNNTSYNNCAGYYNQNDNYYGSYYYNWWSGVPSSCYRSW